MSILASLLAGLVFGLGIIVSGMADPAESWAFWTSAAHGTHRWAKGVQAITIGRRLAVSAGGEIDQTAVAFNVFAGLLRTDGIQAALYPVLRRSDFRFISIFRFKDGKATSAVHVDREDLSVTQAAEVPDTATYCRYVRNQSGAFVTADASTDPRTAGHPAREVVRAYCGIPIFEPEGALIGTLCYYDLVPRNPAQLDLELLIQLNSAIAQSGLVPPYPSV